MHIIQTMNIETIKTLGALKASGYKSKSIKEELRTNLIEKMKSGQEVFAGVHGYENTVIPELERAILSKHNINLLGLRGQAKTRLARLIIGINKLITAQSRPKNLRNYTFGRKLRSPTDTSAKQIRRQRFMRRLANMSQTQETDPNLVPLSQCPLSEDDETQLPTNSPPSPHTLGAAPGLQFNNQL